jgi:hypothetical protein
MPSTALLSSHLPVLQVPLDTHVLLAPLEWASITACVFSRNPHLLHPASAAPIVLFQVLLGVLLPTSILYFLESSQRRQFLRLLQQQPLSRRCSEGASSSSSTLARGSKDWSGNCGAPKAGLETLQHSQPPQQQAQQQVEEQRQEAPEQQPAIQHTQLHPEQHAPVSPRPLVLAQLMQRLQGQVHMESGMSRDINRNRVLYKPQSVPVLVSVKVCGLPSSVHFLAWLILCLAASEVVVTLPGMCLLSTATALVYMVQQHSLAIKHTHL